MWSVVKGEGTAKDRVYPSRSFDMCNLCARLTGCKRCYYVPSEENDDDNDYSPEKVLAAPVRKYMSAGTRIGAL